MKIGDAGEAFFVFETDEDIPENIVTSPLLEATKPGQANVQPTDRFGAKVEGDQDQPQDSQEPDFFDLDASTGAKDTPPASHPNDSHEREESGSGSPGILARTAAAGKAAIGMAHEAGRTGIDKVKDHQVKEAITEVEHENWSYMKDSLTAARNSALAPSYLGLGREKGDEALPNVASEKGKAPEVTYGHGTCTRSLLLQNYALSTMIRYGLRRSRLPRTVARQGTVR